MLTLATNNNFLIPLQLDGVNLSYFKQNIKVIQYKIAKI